MMRILLVGLLLFFSLISRAQPPQLHNVFEHYSTQNGLSQNDIRCIFQDSFGFIWIGTHGGLNRFDGYNFKTFIRDELNPYSVPSNLISAITEDTLGNLWIGTDDHGLVMLDRKSARFINYFNTSDNPEVLTDNHIISLFVDSRNRIWVVTQNGLNLITLPLPDADKELSQPEIKKHFASSGNVFHCGLEDPSGNIWIGTRNGLKRYLGLNNHDEVHFINYENEDIINVRNMALNDSSLIITTANKVLSLPFSSINNSAPGYYTIYEGQLGEHISDSNGNLWFTSREGILLNYVHDGELRTHQFQSNWSDPKSLSGDITTSLLEDNNGMIWIGTNGNGLNLYNPKRRIFDHFQRNVEKGSISYNKIRAIEEDQYGNLWFGTEGGGLNLILNPERNDFRSKFQQFDVNIGGNNFVFAIEEGRFKNRSRVFLGTGFGTGLEVMDRLPSGKYVRQVVAGFSSGGGVFDIHQDSRSNLWLATYRNGLFQLTMDDYGNIVDSRHFTTEDGLSSNVVRSITEDHKGNFWVGTDGGISKITNYYGEDLDITSYRSNPKDPAGLSYNYILPIYVAKNEEIWIGTLGGGLNRVISKAGRGNDQFERITMNDGLPSNVIKSIEEDRDGNLWLGSNMGLSKFSPKTGQIVNYGPSDGLQDQEFSELASTTRQNGQMIFGGVNGFNTFHPDNITVDQSELELVFTGLTVLNQEIQTGRNFNDRILLDDDLNCIARIDLNHDENSFSVSFAALNFVSAENNRYLYKLDNFDDEWLVAGAESRTAKYTNLPAGKYTLMVKASNADGVWNDQPKMLGVYIAPPIWNTWWARVFYLLVFGLGLWFFRKYTVITNTRKNQLLIEKIEKEKLEELSQLKLRFFTNISHEFRTPLTLILGLIDRLKRANGLMREERDKYYDKIYRNSQVLLNLINQLIDFRKMEQGKMDIRVSHGNIGEYIQQLTENFNEVARRKMIDYTFICEHPITGYYDKDVIERIMFNLLSNAFKFTNNEDEITVSIEQENESFFRLEVEDSGRGIPEKIQEHLFERFAGTRVSSEVGSGIGLSYTKGLVDLYKGEISFKSKVDVGTKFTVMLPYSGNMFDETMIKEEGTDKFSFKKDVNWIIEDTGHKSHQQKDNLLKKNHTILLVEDNEDILSYLKEHFEKMYEVLMAKEGQEALEYCLNDHVDLVVSDIMMPGMDGITFCETLKQDDRINHIPVILLTAKKSDESKLKGYEKGADAYIGKPFQMQELETRMESLISSRKKLLSKIRHNVNLEPNEIEITSLDERFIKRVMGYIEENIGMTEFTVEMLAHECGMSQLHLNKKLKVLVGQTANAFIRSIRLKRAAQLLSKDRYSVSEVMYEVGFIDAKYFRSCFKKEFGVTPSDYQRQHSLAE